MRPLVLLGVLALGLFLWNGRLEDAAEARRAERNRVARLLTDEERESLEVAALIVEVGGRSWLYGSVRGEWRCLDLYRAPVDPAALQSLMGKLTRAEGLRRSDETSEAASFGIGTGDTIRVSFAGRRVLDDPGRDLRLSIDVGRSVPGRDAAFVRIRGRREIWEIDSDPRIELATDGARPPLLAPGVVPASWQGFQGLERIFVDRAEGGYELVKRAVEVTPEEMREGRLPWRWILDPGPDEVVVENIRARGLSLFVQRLPYRTVIDPARREEFNLARPGFVVTLSGKDGAALQLSLGKNAAGEFAAWNSATECLYALDPEVVALLAPPRESFLGADDANPYDPYLRHGGGNF